MGNEAFQNASFENASFGNGNEDSSCLSAIVVYNPSNLNIGNWKHCVSKCGILKSLVSHVLNFKSWIKFIYDTVDICNFVISEFI